MRLRDRARFDTWRALYLAAGPTGPAKAAPEGRVPPKPCSVRARLGPGSAGQNRELLAPVGAHDTPKAQLGDAGLEEPGRDR